VNFNNRTSKPFLVGIAGDSASGKTTFASSLVSLFGKENVLSFSLDDYHLYNRDERKRLGITPLHPEANDLNKIYRDIRQLKKGRGILKPSYDHSTGEFGESIYTEPKELIIVEGLHTLYRKRIRELFDITLYIDPDYQIRKEWKIDRDVKKRGHKEKDVIEEMERRLPDYQRYIAPQRNRAEILIQIKKERKKDIYKKGTPYWIRIYQKLTGEKLSNVYFPFNLSSMCEEDSRELYFEYRKGIKRKKGYSVLEFNGIVERGLLKDIEDKIREISGKKGQILKKQLITEIELGQLIITWRVAERYRKLNL